MGRRRSKDGEGRRGGGEEGGPGRRRETETRGEREEGQGVRPARRRNLPHPRKPGRGAGVPFSYAPSGKAEAGEGTPFHKFPPRPPLRPPDRTLGSFRRTTRPHTRSRVGTLSPLWFLSQDLPTTPTPTQSRPGGAPTPRPEVMFSGWGRVTDRGDPSCLLEQYPGLDPSRATSSVLGQVKKEGEGDPFTEQLCPL